jgi:DNA primase
MPRYTQDSLDRVRDAIDMIELVGAKTELRRAGNNRYEGLCPFHDERTPSFGIDPVKKVYHCFGCGAGGDAIRFVQETEGVDFLGAIELLADRYGIELEAADEDPQAAERRRRRERLHELLDRTATFYTRFLWESREAARARTYLLGRGLEEEALRRFRVGYAPSAWDTVLTHSHRAGYGFRELYDIGLARRGRQGRLYDAFRARVTFPLCDMRGRVTGFGARALGDRHGPKYLNTPEGELFHKGRQVYGAHLARAAAAKAGAVIVAEGYTDVIALHQAGFEHVVGIMGTALTEEQVRILRRLAPVALLALDADNAGQEAMLRAARVAQGEQLELRVVPLPGGLDPADLVVQQGASEVAALLDRSMPFVRFQVLRTIERGDTRTAEGKDAVIDALRPVLRPLPRSVLRDELVRLVSDRLDVPAGLVEELLAGGAGAGGAPGASSGGPVPGAWAPASPRGSHAGGTRPRSGPDAGRPGGRAAGRRAGPAGHHRLSGVAAAPRVGPAAHDPRVDPAAPEPRPAAAAAARAEEVERRFLAFCLALPEAGADALARVDPDEHFTAPLLRRAARHLLATGLADPTATVEPGDEELEALMRELVVRAAREPVSPATLDAQRLQLELRRLDRRLAAARRAGEPGITELAGRRAAVKAEFDRAMERASAAP